MPEISLPYRTDWAEMLAIVDYVKANGADRDSLDARFGAGEMLRETLNALEELGLLQRDESDLFRLTTRGEQLAYAASEDERADILLESFLDYSPYRVPLERARDENRSVIDAPWLERVWQMDMRLGQPRIRVAEARTFFLRLGEIAGLGTFQRGVRGQPSRLVLGEVFAERLRKAEHRWVAQLAERGRDERGVAPRFEEPAVPSVAPGVSRDAASRGAIQIVINVDLSEWDLERIERFLDLLAERMPGAGITIRSPD